jgi:hypothetical protein
MNARSAIAAVLVSLLAAAGIAQAQSSSTGSSSQNNAATSTGTSTSQSEMNRGVPGVDVDVGRNAKGAVDVTADHNTDTRNVTGNDATSTSGTSDANRSGTRTRAARADRG